MEKAQKIFTGIDDGGGYRGSEGQTDKGGLCDQPFVMTGYRDC